MSFTRTVDHVGSVPVHAPERRLELKYPVKAEEQSRLFS